MRADFSFTLTSARAPGEGESQTVMRKNTTTLSLQSIKHARRRRRILITICYTTHVRAEQGSSSSCDSFSLSTSRLFFLSSIPSVRSLSTITCMSSAHVDHRRKNTNHAIDSRHAHVNGRNCRISCMIARALLQLTSTDTFTCTSTKSRRLPWPVLTRDSF